jgi:hypothetical protein
MFGNSTPVGQFGACYAQWILSMRRLKTLKLILNFYVSIYSFIFFTATGFDRL